VKRRNPFPGVTRSKDRHGKVRWRLRRTIMGRKIDTYLPGSYGSVEFRQGYEAAIDGARVSSREPRAKHGSLAWLIEVYLRSPKHRNKADQTRNVLRRELDWLREVAGNYPVAHCRAKHVEAVMNMKAGPAAANKVRKNLSMLFNFAIKLEVLTFNPARAADKMKESGDGFYTWTEDDMHRFLAHHDAGTKARLIFMLALNTGAARQDLAAMTRGNISGRRIRYGRGKTGVGGDFQLEPGLETELSHLPADQMVLIAHGAQHLPYTPVTLGNLFKRYCREAGLPQCTLHGIRKGQATRMVNNGATPDEIMAYLAHKTNAEGITYTKKSNRSRLADTALSRLDEPKREQKLSNLPERLDKESNKRLKGK